MNIKALAATTAMSAAVLLAPATVAAHPNNWHLCIYNLPLFFYY